MGMRLKGRLLTATSHKASPTAGTHKENAAQCLTFSPSFAMCGKRGSTSEKRPTWSLCCFFCLFCFVFPRTIRCIPEGGSKGGTAWPPTPSSPSPPPQPAATAQLRSQRFPARLARQLRSVRSYWRKASKIPALPQDAFRIGDRLPNAAFSLVGWRRR